MLVAKVVTVSDGVVDGVREDRSGAALGGREVTPIIPAPAYPW